MPYRKTFYIPDEVIDIASRAVRDHNRSPRLSIGPLGEWMITFECGDKVIIAPEAYCPEDITSTREALEAAEDALAHLVEGRDGRNTKSRVLLGKDALALVRMALK